MEREKEREIGRRRGGKEKEGEGEGGRVLHRRTPARLPGPIHLSHAAKVPAPRLQPFQVIITIITLTYS